MAEAQQQNQTAAAAAASEGAAGSLLENAIAATKNTERDRAEVLLKAFTEEALKGTVTWSRNLTETVNNAIKSLDKVLSKQVSKILHAPEFQKLEGSWRGLHYMVKNTLCGEDLKIKVLNVDKRTLHKDMLKSIEFDQSTIFKKIYEDEFGTPGGEPYSVLIGDYEFTNRHDDIQFLTNISSIAAASFAPFIASASAGMIGVDKWTDLSKPRDLEQISNSLEFAKWRGFRDSEDSRFVSLTMPRTLARVPYGSNTVPVEEFEFEETEMTPEGKSRGLAHDEYTWMSTAYVMGAKMTDAYSKYGWCTAIRGVEGGGKVENLPTHVFQSDDGDSDMKCPTEIGITDRREAELSKLGFLPLCHYKNTSYAVFFGGQTTQRPKVFDDVAATENAAISARLPYIMSTSRFAHYLKVIARDQIGSFQTKDGLQAYLDHWIKDYVNSNEASGQELKSRYPLRDAKVEVKEIPGRPGAYNAVAWLQPWMQFEELTTSLRLVARIPEK